MEKCTVCGNTGKEVQEKLLDTHEKLNILQSGIIKKDNVVISELRNFLYRAKEILGAHIADLSPVEKEFFFRMDKLLGK